MIFSNVTTLRLANVMANPSVCHLSVTCVHPTQGFNFLGIFCTILHHCLANGNSPTKNHEDRPRGSPLQANLPNWRVAVRVL